MTPKSTLRSDLGISLSLANLIFFKAWSDLTLGSVNTPAVDWPYEISSATPPSHLALMSLVLIIAFLLFTMLRATVNSPRLRAGVHLILFGFCFLVLNGIRLALGLGPWVDSIGKQFLIPLLSTVILSLGFLYWRKQATLIRVFRGFLLVFLPFTVVTFYHGISGTFRSEAQTILVLDVPPPSESAPRNRIVWMLFDGMDYEMSWEKRPPGLELPTLDQLRRESLFLTHAVPPGHQTSFSIPSYILGEYVNEPPIWLGGRDWEVGLRKNNRKVSLGKSPNLFSDLAAEGKRTAVVGWYLPYCNAFGQDLVFCRRASHYNFSKIPYSRDYSLSMQRFLEELTYLRPYKAQYHLNSFNLISQFAKDKLRDKDIDVLYVHYNIPHAPWIYERIDNEVRARRHERAEGYLDNLELVDRVLADTKKLLQDNNLWDSTTLLISADHGWHFKEKTSMGPGGPLGERRIPFIVHLPQSLEGVEYHAPFETIYTREFLVSLSKGQFPDYASMVKWLTAHPYRYEQFPSLNSKG